MEAAGYAYLVDNNVAAKLLLDSSACGVVIGRNGANRSSIQQRYQVGKLGRGWRSLLEEKQYHSLSFFPSPPSLSFLILCMRLIHSVPVGQDPAGPRLRPGRPSVGRTLCVVSARVHEPYMSPVSPLNTFPRSHPQYHAGCCACRSGCNAATRGSTFTALTTALRWSQGLRSQT